VIDSNALLLALALSVLTVLGYGITASLLPARLFWLRLALAPGSGAGLCALIFYLFRRPMFTVEFALLGVLILLLWLRRQSPFKYPDISAETFALLTLILPAITLTLSAFVVRIHRMPHGNWDGWAIWNWEARLLYRTGAHFRDYLPFAFHGDYPLLVPSVTARFWRYAGMEVPETGAWLGIVLALCSIAVLVLTLAELRGAVLGTLMALTLIGTPNYLDYATSQYADIPISFFFLGSVALIAIYFERDNEPDRERMLALSGFLAGCAGWTKNEGIVFMMAASIALLLPVIRARAETLRRFAAFATGAAAPVAVIVLFKLTNTVKNYVVAYEPGKLQKALDWDRHAMILRYLGKFIFSFGAWSFSPFIPLLALIVVTGVSRRVVTSYGWLTIVFILVFLSAGYYFVYLTTPVELKVHLEGSLDRLLLQLWPSILLVAGLICERDFRRADRLKVIPG
jgi:hypothetical protein